MYEVTFNRDGSITVFAINDGTTVRVTAPVNQLQELLPSKVFDAVRSRMALFLDLTPQLKRVV